VNHRQPQHVMSRYWHVTEGVIEKCQQDYRAGRDMGRSIPNLNATRSILVAIQSMSGDALVHEPLDTILTLPLDQLDDWSLTILAEILFSIADQMGGGLKKTLLKEQRRPIEDRAWAALEQALDSPVLSPLVWYEDIFIDVAQQYHFKGDPHAVDLMKRGLAHDLRYNDGDNADGLLRDLAETYLWVGAHDKGLALFTAVLRNDPADIWIYNVIGLTFDHFGLTTLGIEATRRGLEVLDATGDPEDLRDQFLDTLKRLEKSKRPGKEGSIDPSVLADFRTALALDLDAGKGWPISDLCHDLVPDLDQVPVKREPQPSDLPPGEKKKGAQGAGKTRQQAKRRGGKRGKRR
jgi:tetratricopeptide (TPR) repeat protein